ncbi:ABC transporter ATP-binding protein [uncultured Hydrogenophaga sp.]|uniref:ABC transporter ATP-binding protein n=1 Tax=uncultured Hydrogenophaga sp. TaxID=199683 RepID=UPI00265E2037|nr:ABC transporter ATP-binding protein [uncultured Hydrogenophaga sp.]
MAEADQPLVPAPAPRALVVNLREVRKAYNAGTPIETEVLHGIDLQVQRGEFCAVVGPSGSGKSTLLNIVGLLDRPTSGTVEVCGEQTIGLDDLALTRLRGHSIGFVFQYHHLITAFSALENVMMPMLGARGFADEAMRLRAQDLIGRVGLSAWQDNLAGNLSGGQQQRVAIARALVMNPALVLADEPTGNLDTRSADEVFALLRQFNRDHGTTVLFVTHNPGLAARCDETIEVIDGRVTH